jgi:hypothetical protein
MFHERDSNVLESKDSAPSSRCFRKILAVVALLALILLIPVAGALQTNHVLLPSQAGRYGWACGDDNDDNKNQGKKMGGLMLLVEPAVVAIKAKDKAEYSVVVTDYKSNEGMVYLTMSGLPENTIGIFTPNMGVPNFVSRLTIITEDVKPGSYELTINAMNRKQSQTAKVALTIQGTETTSAETTTSTQTTTITSTSGAEHQNLKITFSTDKLSYNTGEPVIIEGVVTDSSQNSVHGAIVSIQVENPLGSTSHIYQTPSDLQGFFNDTFTLPNNAVNGTYIASVSAVNEGQSGLAHSTFVVGQSATPACSILSLNITANGIPAMTFKQGQEVLISVQVSNLGSDLEKGMVWLEIDNPLDVPVYITMVSTRFGHSQVVALEFHFFLQENAIVGVYAANAYVSNGYISRGGVFFDKEQKAFIVETTHSTSTTTTTTNQTSTTTVETTSQNTTTIANATVTNTTNVTTTSETTTQTTISVTINTTTQTNETSTTSTSSQTSFTGTEATGGLSPTSASTARKTESTWRSNLQ